MSMIETLVPKMVKGFFGELFADKGYISRKLFGFLLAAKTR